MNSTGITRLDCKLLECNNLPLMLDQQRRAQFYQAAMQLAQRMPKIQVAGDKVITSDLPPDQKARVDTVLKAYGQNLGLSEQDLQSMVPSIGQQPTPESMSPAPVPSPTPSAAQPQPTAQAGGQSPAPQQVAPGITVTDYGMKLPVSKQVADLVGMPELEGKMLSGGDFGKLVAAANIPLRIKQQAISMMNAQTAQGNLAQRKNAFERDTFGTVGGRDVAGTLFDPNGNPLGWKAPGAPTAANRTMGQTAATIIPHIYQQYVFCYV